MRFKQGTIYKTETHRKCSVCFEWKTHDQYGKRKGYCKECGLIQNRNYYRNLTGERLDRAISLAVARKKRWKARQAKKREREAISAINALQHHGLSQGGIERLTGVSRRTIRLIMRGEVAFVKQRTVDRLYDGLERVITGNP